MNTPTPRKNQQAHTPEKGPARDEAAAAAARRLQKPPSQRRRKMVIGPTTPSGPDVLITPVPRRAG